MLNEVQIASVRQWLDEGATLSEVQQRLKEEFELIMTYMEVRMMVLEIGASVQDRAEPEALTPADAAAADLGESDPYGEQPFDNAGGVSVSIDRVMRPGAMVSGEVTFADGERGTWLIDQYGRFGLDPATPGYQPDDEDLAAFQNALRMEMKRHGYG